MTAYSGIKKHVINHKVVNNSIILQASKKVIHLLLVTHWLDGAYSSNEEEYLFIFLQDIST